jgi:hypothetical protein
VKYILSFFDPFRARLASKLSKSTHMTFLKWFHKNSIWVPKNTEFDADFKSVENFSNSLAGEM